MNENHPKINYKDEVLLINLRTRIVRVGDIRKYLKVLSDRRVIEVNPIIWQQY